MEMSFYDKLYSKRVKMWPSEHVVAFVESHRRTLVQEKVLDIGCGAGRHSIYMARRGIEVYGNDASPVAIEIARAWAHQEELSIRFEVSDFTELPFPDQCFTGVISWETHCYGDFDTLCRGIAEAFRVLVPGGQFLLMVKSKDDFRWRTFPRVGEHSCQSEQSLVMTCLTRSEVEQLLEPYARTVNIEILQESHGNGLHLVSNFVVTGTRR